MVGAIAANPHEGSRSEYLAQYIFASFGTAGAGPHHEDSGIDLYCTLTERSDGRAWPTKYFSVQVKSTMEPWKFKSEKSVDWLVRYPSPLFLCIVDKTSLRIRVYHTAPRFYLWALPPLPQRVELTPEVRSEGLSTAWKGGENFSLSAPILDFSIQEIIQDNFHRQVKSVLEFWIRLDQENLHRINTGIHSFKMPAKCYTNEIRPCPWAIQEIRKAENIEVVLEHLKEVLSWITRQLHLRGELPTAACGSLLLRQLFPDEDVIHNDDLCRRVNQVLGRDNYLYVGIDALNDMITHRLGCPKS